MEILNCYARGMKICSEPGRPLGGFIAKNTQKLQVTNCYAADIEEYRVGAKDADKTSSKYIFGNDEQGRKVVTNCHSTFVGGDGTSATVGRDCLSEVTSKDDLISEIATGAAACAFTSDTESINNGFPILKDVVNMTLKKPARAGTLVAPYQIGNARELVWARNSINTDTAGTGASKASYILTADIDLGNNKWKPIGFDIPFKGIFDGNGYTISNAEVNATDIDTFAFASDGKSASEATGTLGFFARVTDATIKNLALNNISVIYPPKAPRAYAEGGFVGVLDGSSLIKNCSITDSAVLHNDKGYITGAQAVGGFAGLIKNADVKIMNCYVRGMRLCGPEDNWICGFFGKSEAKATVENCYAAEVEEDHSDANKETLSAQYSFGYDKTKSMSVTKCYSTFECLTGTKPEPNANMMHDEKNDVKGAVINCVGKTSVTVSTIIEGLVNNERDCPYVADSGNTNNGYPILNPNPTSDEKACEDTKEWLDDHMLSITSVKQMENFTLPINYEDDEDVTISWTSSREQSLLINNETGNVIVTLDKEQEHDVDLTATIKRNDEIIYVLYTVTVEQLIIIDVTIPVEVNSSGELELAPTVSTNAETGVTTHTLSVMPGASPGVSKLIFTAVKKDSEGTIIESVPDTKPVSTNTPVNLSVEMTPASSGEKITYYLWDQNFVSLLDNAPNDVTGLIADPYTKGIQFLWNPAADDSGEAVWLLKRYICT